LKKNITTQQGKKNVEEIKKKRE